MIEDKDKALIKKAIKDYQQSLMIDKDPDSGLVDEVIKYVDKEGGFEDCPNRADIIKAKTIQFLSLKGQNLV